MPVGGPRRYDPADTARLVDEVHGEPVGERRHDDIDEMDKGVVVGVKGPCELIAGPRKKREVQTGVLGAQPAASLGPRELRALTMQDEDDSTQADGHAR